MRHCLTFLILGRNYFCIPFINIKKTEILNWETLLCLGDSITIGARSYMGYPEYTGAILENKTQKKWNVINHAVSGYTTIDLLRYVDSSWSHLQQTNPEVVTIMIGTNDIKTNTKDSDFEIAYKLLVVKAKLLQKNSNIILFEIPQLENGVMLPYTIDMNSRIDSFNSIIERIAEEEGLMMHKFNQKEEYFYDGVHLNNQGSASWGDQLAEFIYNLRTKK